MENNNSFLPFGNNISIKPDTKDQILKTNTFCEHGKVVAVGDEVVKDIKVGDEVAFWLFGIKEVAHGEDKHYILPVDDRFILELKKNGR